MCHMCRVAVEVTTHMKIKTDSYENQKQTALF